MRLVLSSNYLICLALTHGLRSRSTQHWLYGLLLLVLLLSGCGLVLLVVEIVKRCRIDVRSIAITNQKEELNQLTPETGARKKVTRIASELLIVVITGITLYRVGYAKAQADLLRDRYHYEEVLVEERYDASNFTLRPDRMQPFGYTSCIPMNWKVGEKMIYLHFKWHPDCNDAGPAGDFKFHRDEHGNRIIYPTEVADAR